VVRAGAVDPLAVDEDVQVAALVAADDDLVRDAPLPQLPDARELLERLGRVAGGALRISAASTVSRGDGPTTVRRSRTPARRSVTSRSRLSPAASATSATVRVTKPGSSTRSWYGPRTEPPDEVEAPVAGSDGARRGRPDGEGRR
jgi:hypothetical protein